MAAKQPDRTDAMIKKRAPAADPAPIDVPGPETLDERGKRRQTLYLPLGVYEHIRDTCHTRRISQQRFFREVFEFYFVKHGGKTSAELEQAYSAPKAKPKRK